MLTKESAAIPSSRIRACSGAKMFSPWSNTNPTSSAERLAEQVLLREAEGMVDRAAEAQCSLASG